MSWKDTIKKEEAPVEKAAAPKSWKDTIQKEEAEASAPVESDSALENILEGTGGAVGGGAVGYGAGKLVNLTGEVAAKGANKILESVGSLSPEQSSFITANASDYTKADKFSDMLNQVRDIGQNVRNKGYNSAEAARAALKDAPESILTEDIHKRLAVPTKEKIIPRTDLEEVKAQLNETRMSEVRPDIDKNAKASTELEAKMSQLNGQKYVSPQEAKIAELEELLKAPKADVPFMAKQKAGELLYNRKVQRIDEDLALNPENRKLNNKKEDTLYTRKVKQDELGTVRPHNNAAKIEKMEKKLAELKVLKESGTAEAIAKKENDIKKMLNTKDAKDNAVKSLTNNAKTAGEADFNNMLRTPQEIRNTDPEFFNKGVLPEQYAKEVELTLKDVRDLGKQNTLESADDVMRRTRDRSIYEKGAEQTQAQKFAKSQAEEIRKLIGEKNIDYDNLMKESSSAIDIEEKLLDSKYGGLELDEKLGRGKDIIFPENKRGVFAGKLASGADEFIDEKTAFKATLDDLAKQGYLPNGTNPEEFNRQLKLSGLKDSVKNTQQLKLKGFDGANLVKSPTGVIKPFIDTMGTKAQEMVALSKGDGILKTAGNVAGTVGKALPGILGVGGAILGATSAAQAGELSPAAATVAGVADAAMPLPLDVIQGSVQAKKGYNESIDEQKMTDEYFNGGDVSQAQAIGAGALGGARGLVQPAIDLGNMASQAGTEKSLDARSRMEQQMSALDSLKPKSDKPKTNEFLNFVDKNPEALKQLADTLQAGAGQAYAGPLLKAAEGNEKQRAAILFGLYQQPAFRSLIGEGSMLNDNIPGVKKKDEDELTAVKVPRPM